MATLEFGNSAERKQNQIYLDWDSSAKLKVRLQLESGTSWLVALAMEIIRMPRKAWML